MADRAKTNLDSYQASKKEKMAQEIMAAIERLEKMGTKATQQAIADEVGCHVNTLKQPYIRELLKEHNILRGGRDNPEHEIKLLQDRINTLESRLAHSINYNARLKKENEYLRSKAEEFELKYRRLLAKYQIDVGNMKIGF